MTSLTATSCGSGNIRRIRQLNDIKPQRDGQESKDSSGESDGKAGSGGGSNIRIQHLTGSPSQVRSRFPKLEECAHFHYEYVDLGQLTVSISDEQEELKYCGSGSLESGENSENKWIIVNVTSQGYTWYLRRSYENFRILDQQLHQCIYDRKFSALPELPTVDNIQHASSEDCQASIKKLLTNYCERFTSIAGNLINCGPVLSWLQLDNRGHRILITDGDNCPINTPAVAAAYAIKKYVAVASDEISFNIGDMISVIDMPPPEDSIWWRGKRGFMVGFFPSSCVAVITDKVPRNLNLNQPSIVIEPSKPVLRKHGKLISFFRAFILSRPSRRTLKQSGILKERVFGCDLGEHLLNTGREVPMVLKCCSEFIETYGIVDGIYRLSGVTSNIQKLRATFDEDRIPALYNDDLILQDIHSVASLLKMYFRELPIPLCTYQLYKTFVAAVQHEIPSERIFLMRESVQKLPPPHFRTLEYLMYHLSRVAEHGGRTGMTARNIAIVWAPNLLRCKELEVGGVAALQGVGVQAVVTEFLITNAEFVFAKDEDRCCSSQPLSRKSRPKSMSVSTPSRLLSLEEARTKQFGYGDGKRGSSDGNYIEVGGGPSCLPEKYHTVIDLPARKRSSLKRTPLGWKTLFSRSSSSGNGSGSLRKSFSGKRKNSVPSEMFKKGLEPGEGVDAKAHLRSFKSVESLVPPSISAAVPMPAQNGGEEEFPPAPGTPSSPKLNGTHSRSVSHDSYFDHLDENTPVHTVGGEDDEDDEGILNDLRANFDLDESEMRIFSEEESTQMLSDASSLDRVNAKKMPQLASAEDTLIVDPSPKRHKTNDDSSCSSISLFEDTAVCNKRSRLEERLSGEDFAYIDSHPVVAENNIPKGEKGEHLTSSTDTAFADSESPSSSGMRSSNPYIPLSEEGANLDYQLLITDSMTSSTISADNKVVCSHYENVSKNRFSYPSCNPLPPVGRIFPESDENEADAVATNLDANYDYICVVKGVEDYNKGEDEGYELVGNLSQSGKNACESPYELVSVVENKMTPATARDTFSPSVVVVESCYERVSPKPFVPEQADGNEIRHSNLTNGVSEDFPLHYDVISEASSSDSEEVENPLYESLVGEDSSPDTRNQITPTTPLAAACKMECLPEEKTEGLEEKEITSMSAFRGPNLEIFENGTAEGDTNTNHLEETVFFLPQTESPCDDEENAGTRANPISKPKVTAVFLKPTSVLSERKSENEEPHAVVFKRPQTLKLTASERDKISDETNIRGDEFNSLQRKATTLSILARTVNTVNREKESQNNEDDNIGCVQHLLSKFENGDETKSVEMNCDALKKSSFAIYPGVYIADVDFGNEKEERQNPISSPSSPESKLDDPIRRDRIEKYKEERRMMLRQKYKIVENEAEDEEMIRRFKQRIWNKNVAGEREIPGKAGFNENVFSNGGDRDTKMKSQSVTTINISYSPHKKDFDAGSGVSAVGKCENAASKRDKWFVTHSERERSSFTLSLERRKYLKKGKNAFTGDIEIGSSDGLVMKRVNQLAQASSQSSDGRNDKDDPVTDIRSTREKLVRPRAFSTSGQSPSYCIRDIAAIFEQKESKK